MCTARSLVKIKEQTDLSISVYVWVGGDNQKCYLILERERERDRETERQRDRETETERQREFHLNEALEKLSMVGKYQENGFLGSGVGTFWGVIDVGGLCLAFVKTSNVHLRFVHFIRYG